MNNLARKLIRCGSARARIRMNLISMSIGFGLLFIGAACVIVKALSETDVCFNGQLREMFFLLPVSAAFMFCGFTAFIVTGIRNTINMLSSQNKAAKVESLRVVMICIAVVTLCIGAAMFLMEANSGACTAPIGLACLTLAAIACILSAALKSEVENNEKKQ